MSSERIFFQFGKFIFHTCDLYYGYYTYEQIEKLLDNRTTPLDEIIYATTSYGMHFQTTSSIPVFNTDTFSQFIFGGHYDFSHFDI